MQRTSVPAISLIVAGLCALAFSFLSWSGEDSIHFLVLDGDAIPTGPFGLDLVWLARLADIAAALGLSAAVCGVLALRWPLTAVAALVGVALLAGAVFIAAWLADPVQSSSAGATSVSFEWPAYAAAIALLDAAVSAFWLARRAYGN